MPSLSLLSCILSMPYPSLGSLFLPFKDSKTEEKQGKHVPISKRMINLHLEDHSQLAFYGTMKAQEELERPISTSAAAFWARQRVDETPSPGLLATWGVLQTYHRR